MLQATNLEVVRCVAVYTTRRRYTQFAMLYTIHNYNPIKCVHGLVNVVLAGPLSAYSITASDITLHGRECGNTIVILVVVLANASLKQL